ncbi:MAG TPA: PadR family transcriptional regulator [bacterium]|nr:PadR family transcriptional regulator [bacterium]
MAHDEGHLDLRNWTTQIRKGLLELCALRLLADGEMYGYDLVKRLASAKTLVVTEGTVYPLLSRLHKAGLVKSRLEESSSGPARRYYSLTEEGKETLVLMQMYWEEVQRSVASLKLQIQS